VFTQSVQKFIFLQGAGGSGSTIIKSVVLRDLNLALQQPSTMMLFCKVGLCVFRLHIAIHLSVVGEKEAVLVM
jgi:hypothetical protein